jgi:hypothetical protein
VSKLIQDDSWVWVVVQDPGSNEQFLGQHDEEKDVSFIPTFLKKDEAEQCLPYLTRDKAKEYEVQAILFEELAKHSAQNGFVVFILNGAGEVLEKIDF